MYIIAIAWTYVALMAAIVEANLTAAVITFVFWGVLPVSLLLWIMGSPTRRRRRKLAEQAEQAELAAQAAAQADDQPKN